MRKLLACMVTLWMIGNGACAYASPSADAAALDDQVTVAGETRDTPRVTTNGADVPLRVALRRMVPVAYSVILPNAGAWAATPVSWNPGHSLAQTLREMLAAHPELAAQIDTDFQLVTVRYRQPFGADTVGALMASGAGGGAVAGTRGAGGAGGVNGAGAVAGANTQGGSGVTVGGPIGGNAAGANALEAGPNAGLNASPSASTNAGPNAATSRGSGAAAASGVTSSVTSSVTGTGASAPRVPPTLLTGATTPPGAHPATQAERDSLSNAASAATATTPATFRSGMNAAPAATTIGTGTSAAQSGAAVASAATATGAPATAASPAPASTALASLPPPAAPPADAVPQTWQIELSDRTVRGALMRWTKQAGWRLIWEAPVDFAVDAPATLTGTFDEALQAVIGALSNADAPVQAILYRGNKVLRIVEKGAG